VAVVAVRTTITKTMGTIKNSPEGAVAVNELLARIPVIGKGGHHASTSP
jgi:hypothetical protein